MWHGRRADSRDHLGASFDNRRVFRLRSDHEACHVLQEQDGCVSALWCQWHGLSKDVASRDILLIAHLDELCPFARLIGVDYRRLVRDYAYTMAYHRISRLTPADRD